MSHPIFKEIRDIFGEGSIYPPGYPHTAIGLRADGERNPVIPITIYLSSRHNGQYGHVEVTPCGDYKKTAGPSIDDGGLGLLDGAREEQKAWYEW